MLLNRRFHLRRAINAAFLSCTLLTGLTAQIRPRISRPVNDSSLVRLPRTTHPLATTANEIGRVEPGLPMERMMLRLSSSPEQDAAVEQLAADQHDPNSPRYHQWLSPAEFGRQFGPAQEDIDKVTAWLQSHGFSIGQIANSRRLIEFSGTSGQVESAFHTEMHRYRVNGRTHVANANDVSIPDALAAVVSGVVSLHNFGAHPMHHVIQPATPLANLSGGTHGMGPYDFAAIYDVAALWSQSFDGAGQTIAIAGRTNINMGDVTTFRSTFGLGGNNTVVVLNGRDPGIVDSGEETEADLDVEWAGGVAKGATVKFVVSASTNASDGVDLSNQYIVNQNLSSVISLSFGLCEAQLGSATSFYNNLWQQASVQGISVFVAAGDSGSAGCDVDVSSGSNGANTTQPASHGLAVNGLGSTPYNVAVGGTEFADGGNPAAYWNTSNDSHNASAKGYIPESVWNESSFTTAGALGNGLFAGGGGISRVFATPSWQTGPGVPTVDPGTSASHHRYVPDVSVTAAGHDGYLIYQEGKLEMVGGTSASTPAFAGIMAMIDQYTGGRNGNPNNRLYSLAAQNPALFHDVTSGSNAVPCAGGSVNCSALSPSTNIGQTTGFSATPGFDLASGLGSVDAYALALKWSITPPALAISSVTPNPLSASSSAQTITINGSGFQSGTRVQITGFSGSVTITLLTSTQIQASLVAATAGIFTLQVINSNGQSSNSVSMQVNTPAAPPAISSVSPNPMTGSNQSQVLTITGHGFQSNARVYVSNPGSSATLQILSLSATQIQAVITTGTTAQMWTVQVTNPNGAASNIITLQVNAPPTAPSIASVSTLRPSNSSQLITITGANFTPGNGLRVLAGFGPYTLVLQGSQIVSATSTQIQAMINVGSSPRMWLIEVINPNGAVSNLSTFQVTN